MATSRSLRQRYEQWGLREVLCTYTGLSIVPQESESLVIGGTLTFQAEVRGHEPIVDSYEVLVCVPDRFPRKSPMVKERGGRIPAAFHTHRDGSLCLGSPVRLQLALSKDPTLLGFLRNCLVPYLYGYSYFERHGVMPFGELAHGEKGLWLDYVGLFAIQSRESCLAMVQLAAMRKPAANKQPCPCGSGLRVGKCHNRMLNRLRRELGRRWWRDEHERLVALAWDLNE